MRKILNEIFSGENGRISSKRLIGFFGAICLFVKLFQNATPELIYSVLAISGIGLGLTTVEKVTSLIKEVKELKHGKLE